MEIFIIIIILIVVWFIFKIVIPGYKMTFDVMDEVGEASKYVDANHPIKKTQSLGRDCNMLLKNIAKKAIQKKRLQN